jgi:uncharacterized protein (TIGR03032 family)
MSNASDPGVRAPTTGGAACREVPYEYSRNLLSILEHIGSSLLISTYQAGKLVAVGVEGGALDLSFHSFEQAMGVAVAPDRIAVGSRSQIWYLRNAPDVAPRLEPKGHFDACFLARSSHVTGEIHGHEMAWVGRELWVVNTLFSCLCTLHEAHSFVPRWRPPFISGLAAEDRCHLNGLAMVGDRPKFVTAMAETDTPRGWRQGKATTGCLIDVSSGETVARGFAMPHSPRVERDRVWLLDSGRGRLVTVDPATGRAETVAELPGYTRGLAFAGPFAFIGLSKIRETSTFGGVPVADRRDELKCGVGVVELESCRLISLLEFKAGVDEIFDVRVMPGYRHPMISGPFALNEGRQAIWTVPEPRPDAECDRGAPRKVSVIARPAEDLRVEGRPSSGSQDRNRL